MKLYWDLVRQFLPPLFNYSQQEALLNINKTLSSKSELILGMVKAIVLFPTRCCQSAYQIFKVFLYLDMEVRV